MYVGFTSFITISFILYMYFLSSRMSLFLNILGYVSYLYYMTSYTATFLINPGYPQKYLSEEVKLSSNLKYCKTCKIYYDPSKNVVHCYDCNICVEGYDHHCPWTGKCIGRNNISYFYAFISSVFIIFFYFAFAFIFTIDNLNAVRKTPKKKKLLI